MNVWFEEHSPCIWMWKKKKKKHHSQPTRAAGMDCEVQNKVLWRLQTFFFFFGGGGGGSRMEGVVWMWPIDWFCTWVKERGQRGADWPRKRKELTCRAVVFFCYSDTVESLMGWWKTSLTRDHPSFKTTLLKPLFVSFQKPFLSNMSI